MYFEPGTVDDECFGPLQLTDITCPPASIILVSHVDDGHMLAPHEQQLSTQLRLELLYRHWNVLHKFQSFPQLQQWLEALSPTDHHRLLELRSANNSVLWLYQKFFLEYA
jgi:hypothetical protein